MSPSPSTPPSNPLIVVDGQSTSSVTFCAYDAGDPRFSIRGRIDTYADALTFRIVTRILSTGEKSAIRPEELFDAMMVHFAHQPGGLAATLRGIWGDSDTEFVTNLARFNAALAAGCDEPTAAGTTFTGRMATRYHYNTVVFGVTDPPLGPPPYKKVNVYFRR